MRKRALALLGGMVLFGPCCAGKQHQPLPAPPPEPSASDAGEQLLVPDAAAVESSTIPDAAADAPASPCDAMRATADRTQGSGGYQPHLADRRIEDAIRRYYHAKVLARGIDRRSLARHLVVFERHGTAPGAAVAACAEQWRAADPRGIVPDAPPRFEADHRYAEVSFEMNDAGDGENAYTAFVDVATMQVMVLFHYNNFQP